MHLKKLKTLSAFMIFEGEYFTLTQQSNRNYSKDCFTQPADVHIHIVHAQTTFQGLWRTKYHKNYLRIID